MRLCGAYKLDFAYLRKSPKRWRKIVMLKMFKLTRRDSSMDLLWCGSKTRRKAKGSEAKQADVPDEWSSKPSAPTRGASAIPEVNVDLSGMENFTLMITRGRSGFGFTVFGSSPVQVGRVDEGSPAFQAGLRRYDCIVRINGQNVSRSMAESVARIVRESDTSLRLEVQRNSIGGDTLASSTWQLYTDDPPRIPPNESAPTVDEGSIQRPCPLQGMPQLPPRRPFTPLANVQALPRSKVNNDQFSLCSLNCDQTSSSCSELSRFSAPVGKAIGGLSCPRRTMAPGSRPKKKAPMPLPSAALDSVPGSEQGSRVNVTDVVELKEEDEDKEDESGERDSEKEYSDKDGNLSPITDDKKLSSFEQDQRPAILKLIESEEDFVVQMELGLLRYLRPLRNMFLTPEEHWTVFQNLEEVTSLSQCCLQDLNVNSLWCSSQEETNEEGQRTDGASDRNLSINVLSSVYLAKLDSFCSAYESYCPGVMNALHFLASLKRSNPELRTYLKKTSLDARFTISAFLQKPIEHIKELVLALQKILCYMEATASDYSCLKQVVQAMRNCCSTINVSHMQRCNSSMSSLSSLESVPMKSFSSSSSSSNSAAASVVSSIDTEVLEMQKRLVFPDNVRSFHLATASHHMIYSGRLTLIERYASTPLFVALLSDLIVLTRPDPVGEALCVLEEPILLQDVVGCNFNCNHQCEFVVLIETPLTSLKSSWTPRSLVFRAPSVELKCTWKNIFEQRISTCKAQREITISNRRADNVV